MAQCSCDRPPVITLRFEEPIYAQDSANEQIASWRQYWTCSGTAEGVNSRDVVQAEQVQGATTWLLKIPYGPTAMGITAEMRCKFTYGRDVTAYCDGAAMPVGIKQVRVRAQEQTA